MTRDLGKSLLLEGYKSIIASNADRVTAVTEALLSSEHEPLESARLAIRGNFDTTNDLINAIGGIKNPNHRPPYEAALKETRSATLDLVATLLPALEQFAAKDPEDTVRFVNSVVPMLHTRREDNEFAVRRDETEARLCKVGAAALIDVGPAKYSFESESWLRSAKEFIRHATPKVRTQLFERSQTIEGDQSAVGSLKWDLQMLRRLKYGSDLAPAQ